MKFLLRLIVVLLIGIIAVPTAIISAGVVPPLPHAFYGNVTINHTAAPVGTVIEARGEGISNEYPGNPLITTKVGKYGGEGFNNSKLVVQGQWKGIGNYLKPGTEIFFYVNDIQAQCLIGGDWEGNYFYIPGEVTKLKLRVVDPVQLYKGWNNVAYAGNQTAIETFDSVENYIIIVYYWNAKTQLWDQVVANTIMKDAAYFVKVSQNCTWIY